MSEPQRDGVREYEVTYRFVGPALDRQCTPTAAEALGIVTAQIAGLIAALQQLLHEVTQAGFETAEDYNWPKSIADAKAALAAARGDA